MQDYHILSQSFLQQKKFLGYSYRTEEIALKEIVTFLKGRDITKEVTEEYARMNRNRHSNTIARNMGVLREFCKYLKTQGVPCYQIPKKIYPQNHRNYTPYVFSRQEIKTIYQNLEVALKGYHYSYYQKLAYPLIIKILYQTGMRLGEVLSIQRQDYLIEDGCFHLKNTKNNQERLVFLPNTLKQEMNFFFHKFQHQWEKESLIFSISSSTIEQYFYKVLKLSHIPRRENSPRVHNLRQTFVVHKIEEYVNDGKDINVILPVLQKHLGHQSLEALSYYFHLTKDILGEIRMMSEYEFNDLIPEVNHEEF